MTQFLEGPTAPFNKGGGRRGGGAFNHLNINSLLSKIEELCYIAKSTNAADIGVCESKLDASVLDPEISIHNYKILPCNRNRQGGGAVCYVRNDSS